MTTTLNVRIDKNTKDKASAILNKMGLDLSSATKLFLNQIIHEKGIPFTPTVNLKKIKDKWNKESNDALSNGKRFSNSNDLIKSIIK